MVCNTLLDSRVNHSWYLNMIKDYELLSKKTINSYQIREGALEESNSLFIFSSVSKLLDKHRINI